MNSTRLPQKMLKQICGKPVLFHVIERLRQVQGAHEVVVATTTNIQDDKIVELCKEMRCSFYRGSEPDVTDRLIGAARLFEADLMVQCWGDCPLVDPAIIDRAITLYQQSKVDFVSNRLEKSFPAGLETNVFARSVLERVAHLTQDPTDREHGTYYIYTHPKQFTMKNFKAIGYHAPEKRWLLDYPEDLSFHQAVYDRLYHTSPDFRTGDVLNLLIKEPELEKLNNMYPVDLKSYEYYETL